MVFSLLLNSVESVHNLRTHSGAQVQTSVHSLPPLQAHINSRVGCKHTSICLPQLLHTNILSDSSSGSCSSIVSSLNTARMHTGDHFKYAADPLNPCCACSEHQVQMLHSLKQMDENPAWPLCPATVWDNSMVVLSQLCVFPHTHTPKKKK